MKLNELFEAEQTVDDIKAQIKDLQKEMVEARSGGNDDVAKQLKFDIDELKELIKDKEALAK